MQQAVETILTPAHADAFETLLDQPLASALHQPTPQGQPQGVEALVIHMLAMRVQIDIPGNVEP